MDEHGQLASAPRKRVLISSTPHEGKPWLTAPLPTPEFAARLRSLLPPVPRPAAVPAVQQEAA
jgi:hypothetical protein